MENSHGVRDGFLGFLAIIASIGILLLFIVGVWVGFKSVHRSQRVADAKNQITINGVQIQQTQQLVKVAQQKADIKIQEAYGIAKSQAIINDTLTPQYLQHEAIQAQESQSDKIIYVPSGNQGIPLVNAVNP